MLLLSESREARRRCLQKGDKKGQIALMQTTATPTRPSFDGQAAALCMCGEVSA